MTSTSWTVYFMSLRCSSSPMSHQGLVTADGHFKISQGFCEDTHTVNMRLSPQRVYKIFAHPLLCLTLPYAALNRCHYSDLSINSSITVHKPPQCIKIQSIAQIIDPSQCYKKSISCKIYSVFNYLKQRQIDGLCVNTGYVFTSLQVV